MDVYYKKYKRLSGRNVCNEIIDFFKNLERYGDVDYSLTPEQERWLQYYWGDDVGSYGDLNLPFQAYEWKKEKVSGTWLRITLPLWFIFIFLMTVFIRPLKWLITGKWWFGKDSKLENFIAKWSINIFGE